MNKRASRIFPFIAIAFLAAWHCGSRSALAEPAPLDEAELWAEADLIVEGLVLSVTNTGYADFLAQVWIEKTLKGTAPSNPMRYTWVPPEPGLLGPMNHNVFAGQHVRLCLILERGQYIPWVSNSVEWLSEISDEKRILPQQPGDVIYAAGAEPRGDQCRCRRRWRCSRVRR